MAYIKYKELTKYFNFYKELDIDNLPKYVTDYVHKDEKIVRAFATERDRSIFTTHKMVLFDINPITGSNKIFIVPYKFLSVCSIEFNKDNASLLFYVNNGNPLKIKFKNLYTEESKTRLRKLYTFMCDVIIGFDNKN